MTEEKNSNLKLYIKKILKLYSGMNDEYINILTDSESINFLKQAFTHKSVSQENYEVFEILGDSFFSCCIVDYLYSTYPELRKPGNTAYFGRLKIVLISKSTLSSISDMLNIKAHIITEDPLSIDMMEDVFEALIGCLKVLIDKRISPALGYVIVGNFIKNIIKDFPISLKEKYLWDAVSVLKEIMDYNKKKLSFIKDEDIIITVTDNANNNITVYENKILKGDFKETKKSYKVDIKYGNYSSNGTVNIINRVKNKYEKGYSGYNKIKMVTLKIKNEINNEIYTTSGSGNTEEEAKSHSSQKMVDFLLGKGYKKPPHLLV